MGEDELKEFLMDRGFTEEQAEFILKARPKKKSRGSDGGG